MNKERMTKIIKEEDRYRAEYEVLMMMVGSMNFSTKTAYCERVGKPPKWWADRFMPWMKKYYPEMYINIETIIKEQKKIQTIKE